MINHELLIQQIPSIKMAAVNKGSLDVLVNEMGFSRVEASMALSECNGNVEQAIEKLVAGAYAPPPYSEINQTVSAASEKTSPTFVSPDLINLDIEPMKQDLANKGIVFDSNPPPYSQVSLQAELNAWEDKSSADFFELGGMYNRSGGVSVGRCSSCFDEIFENEKAGLTNKAVKDGIRSYHYDCYMKTRGPKCTHCCFPLSKPDLDKNISGKFLIYKGEKYHVECYEKYAGPRCSYCFNVIIETNNKEFTGKWISEGHKMFHEECFYKKMYADERARHS